MPTHPVIRSLHDLGLAAWTGGSLMGAVGLNAAASSLDDPKLRSQAATAGWSRWAPVNSAAIGAHLVGATGLLVTDWPRVRSQQGVARSSAIKTTTTGVGLGVAVWSGLLNRKMAKAGAVPVTGATEAAPSTPPEVARTLRQLKLVQWLNPAVGLALIALSDWQSQQQRASEVTKGRVQRLLPARLTPAPVLGLAAAGALAVLAARRRRTAAQPGPQPKPVDVATDGAPGDTPDAPTGGKQRLQAEAQQGAAGRQPAAQARCGRAGHRGRHHLPRRGRGAARAGHRRQPRPGAGRPGDDRGCPRGHAARRQAGRDQADRAGRARHTHRHRAAARQPGSPNSAPRSATGVAQAHRGRIAVSA